MKKLIAFLLALGVVAAIIAPQEEAGQATSTNSPQQNTAQNKIEPKIVEPTSKEMDELTLAYIKSQKGTISCKKEQIDNQYFAACQIVSLNGNSAPQIWYYDNQKDPNKRFYAFTGNARSTYETYFQNNPILGDYGKTFGLPIPKSLDMEKIVNTFNQKMK